MLKSDTINKLIYFYNHVKQKCDSFYCFSSSYENKLIIFVPSTL